jgi:hypothetical protein
LLRLADFRAKAVVLNTQIPGKSHGQEAVAFLCPPPAMTGRTGPRQ